MADGEWAPAFAGVGNGERESVAVGVIRRWSGWAVREPPLQMTFG